MKVLVESLAHRNDQEYDFGCKTHGQRNHAGRIAASI